MKKHNLKPKPEFVERIEKLLPEKSDRDAYWKILDVEPVNSIRVNTLKTTPEKLKKQLKEKYNWVVNQPWENHPEVLIIESELLPGELGRALEHLLGFYYIQELSSMLPVLTFDFDENDNYLDLCASPGSKTTQAAAVMKNSGNIIANEVSMGRMRILASNIERCGVENTIITKKDGRDFLRNSQKQNLKFDKILVDAPCSGEGTIRSSPKTYVMWSLKSIGSLSKLQKQLASRAFESLKVAGVMVYSTCTHAPEENEGTIDFLLKEFGDKIEILEPTLPVKTRMGITKWEGKKYDKRVALCKRVYPQDNNTEGFFISKLRKMKE